MTLLLLLLSLAATQPRLDAALGRFEALARTLAVWNSGAGPKPPTRRQPSRNCGEP